MSCSLVISQGFESLFQLDYFWFDVNVNTLSRKLAFSCYSQVPGNCGSSEKE